LLMISTQPGAVIGAAHVEARCGGGLGVTN